MLIDIIIVLFVISAVYRGQRTGFLRQFFAASGFFGGLFIGRWLEPFFLELAHTTAARAIITLITMLGAALIFLAIGEYFGLRLKHRLINKQLNKVDNGLGSMLSVVSLLLSIWLMASIAGSLPFNGVQTAVNNSRLIAGLNRLLPPAPTVIANLSHLIDPNGFPDVFIGSEPNPHAKVNLPALGDLAAAVNADRNSAVRIKGQGCGGIVSGSGFVASDDLVATNAHVVAGINRPYIQDTNGNHPATVIWFDPDLDFAVLRAGNLAGKPLVISTANVATGTPAAVLGYPGGGDFAADPAAILHQIKAIGRNIYGSGRTIRDIYEVQAEIIPGNSGGPLIAQDGSVIGVIFAESTSYDHVGYALTTAKISSELKQAITNNHPVSTGSCAE